MKLKNLRIGVVISIIAFATFFNFVNSSNKDRKDTINLESIITSAYAQSESGNWCMAAHTTTGIQKIGPICTCRIDYWWCDGSHTWVSDWWWC